MHHKNILLIARTTRHHDRMRELSHALDVSTLLATPDTFNQAITSGHEFDLVILDVVGASQDILNAVDAYVVDNGFIPILILEELKSRCYKLIFQIVPPAIMTVITVATYPKYIGKVNGIVF